MPIACALFDNNLTSDPDDYAAMVQIRGSANVDDLVQDIIDQSSAVNKPDILAATAARADCGFLILDCGISAGRA